MPRPWVEPQLTGEKIIAAIGRGVRTSRELAKLFGCNAKRINNHIQYLRRRGRVCRCGIVETGATGRPCTIWGVKV